jgi:hypothetical protein
MAELADFEPSDGHLHGCDRAAGCDCAALVRDLAEAPTVTLQRHLIDRVLLSILGASTPEAAAGYVCNRLTVHEKDLLAQVAVTFARDEVLALLGQGEHK